MRLASLGMLIPLLASAQVLVRPDRLPPEFRDMDQWKGEKPLKCDATPIKPRVDFGFRFQAGYAYRIPLSQYLGPNHVWAILTRVTPQGGKPAHLISVIRLPDIPKTKTVAEVGGAFLLGEGQYKVENLLVDDTGRSCSSEWKVTAKRGRGEGNLTIRMPNGSVDWMGSRRRNAKASIPTKPYRLTVLIHAAPLFPRTTRLRSFDRAFLLGSLAPLLEQLSPESVRVIAFNLDQQKKLYSQDGFALEKLDQLSQSLMKMELGVVDYSVLQNRAGHVELLGELINSELESKERPDAVIIIGPQSRYFHRFPEAVLAERSGGDPLFFSLRYAPLFGRGAEFSDVIQNAVKLQKGKTFVVHTPGEFATALRDIESRLEAKRSAPARTVQ